VYQPKISCTSENSQVSNDNTYSISSRNETSSNNFNVKFINNLPPLCIDKNSFLQINDAKKQLLDTSGLSVDFLIKSINDDDNFLDQLTFSKTRLDNTNLIRISNITDFENFKRIFIAEDIFQNKDLNDNKYIKEIDKLIKEQQIIIEKKNYNKNYLENKNSNKVDNDIKIDNKTINYIINNDENQILIDSHVTSVQISTFFLNQDLNTLGLVFHKYQVSTSGVNTEIYNNCLKIQQPKDRIYDTLHFSYFIFCILILFTYFKYSHTEDLRDTVNKSYFLIVAVLIFLLENIFKLNHLLKGTNNSYFTPSLVYDLSNRDRYFFYDENIKFFKGLIVLTMFFHLIYVLFSQKDLMMIKKFFNYVIVVLIIVIFVLILTMTTFMNLIFGSQNSEYSDVTSTFLSMFYYVIGVPRGIDIIKDSKTSVIYVKMILYLLRLFVIYFILVEVIFVFRKVKENEEKEKSKKEKNF